jgi:outer membrane protein
MFKKWPLILFLCLCIPAGAGAETILTAEKARHLALEYNRQFQSAKKELDRSRAEIIATRSGALPSLSLNGRYTRNIEKRQMFLPGEFFDVPGFVKVPASQNHDFDFSLSLTQPIYAGGKVSTALSIAKIYESYSKEKVKEAEAEIIFGAESAFYDAVLAETNVDVLRKAHEQLTYNLEVVEKYFNQGMISEYELLRARVEKLNIEPQLIAAESQLNLSRKQLKSFLGLPLDEDVVLASDLSDTSIAVLPSLDSLVAFALKNRSEIKQAELQKRGYDKAVRIARGDWLYPYLNFNTTYDVSASSDDLKLNNKEVAQSWTASLLLNIPLFDGGRTIGEIRKAKVDYYQALLEEEQTRDNVRLEVERAYDALFQAKKALEVQKETINQAEEGMRIANLRYQSGVGTQLEVLSAQTALTDARSNFAKAVYLLRLAKASLKKATGHDL